MLELKDVSVIFNEGTTLEKKALNDLSVHIHPGEFVTILGSNGAGKSTFFNVITGSAKVKNGTILLDGEDITDLPEHVRSRTIGRLFQDPSQGTAPHLTVEENLGLSISSGRSPFAIAVRKKEEEQFKTLLSQLDMGLEDRLKTPIGLLSGGQRQAITLLMASLQKPDLLLLDEHTAALDPITARKVLDLTDQIIRENRLTTLMITHNMNDAIRLGNRLIMMYNGKIIYDVSGIEKQRLTVEDLHEKFRQAAGSELSDDRTVLI